MNTINTSAVFRSALYGILATSILLLVYASILTLVSGFAYMVDQFSTFWYFVISLAVGFGVQIGLYTYLKSLIHHKDTAGNVVAVSGTTSTVAMISCCAHYLVNILPILGATGFLVLLAQYQIKIFWFGILSSLFGIAYITNKIIKFKKENG